MHHLDLFERLRNVAAFTIRTKPTAMDVVTLMTVGAGRRHADGPSRWFFMARVAVQAFVGAIQHEIRLGVVVESPQAPAIGVVTEPAFCPQAPFVIIIPHVATHTVRPCVLIGWRQVTGPAGGSGMQPDQREFREVMIEGYLRFPTCLVVALVTAGSLLASVDITVLVTTVASAIHFLSV